MDELIAPEEMPASQKPKESPRLRYILANSEKKRIVSVQPRSERSTCFADDTGCWTASPQEFDHAEYQPSKTFKDILNASGVDPKDYQDELQDESRGSGSVIELSIVQIWRPRAEEENKIPL